MTNKMSVQTFLLFKWTTWYKKESKLNYRNKVIHLTFKNSPSHCSEITKLKNFVFL